LTKKILIIGGTGFIGFNLSICCLKKKWKVTSVSTKKPTFKKKLKKVEYIICDIGKFGNLKKTIPKRNFDYVVNLGGHVDHSKKLKVFKSHYLGCKNLADYFCNKKITSFVQIGSGLEYGNNSKPHKEIFKCKPKSHYAMAKYKATKYLINLFNKQNFPVTILRLYQAYGPHQDNNRLIPQVINNSLQDKKFNCTEGKQIRDFIYIEDLIFIIFRIFETKKARGEIFNIGSGEKIKIKNLISKIVKFCKLGTPIYGAIKMREDESMFMCPNLIKIKKILKYKKKFSINKGLKKTINFYK